MSLADEIRGRRVASIARALSIVEDRQEERERLIDALLPHTGRARVIGITGSPGSGKSTLVERLIGFYRKREKRVAVLAVDPSSPFTGGALLGDRVRMQKHSTDPEVFIRSLAARGHLGGTTRHAADAIRVLDAAGYETILVETVGIGQSEIEIAGLADLVILLLVPNAGDEVQVMKSGVMEIGDIYAINKKDLPGASRLKAEVEQVLRPQGPLAGAADGAGESADRFAAGAADGAGESADRFAAGGPPAAPVLLVSALSGEGMEELAAAADRLLAEMAGNGSLARRRRERLRRDIQRIFMQKFHQALDARLGLPQKAEQWAESIGAGQAGLYETINRNLEELLSEVP